MLAGDILGGRFVLERCAAEGGMGQIFLARDQASGEAVAVKVMRGTSAAEHTRFEREARLLAELRHPGIVRYVAHGTAASDKAFLAMEWLSGEDLACRLLRKGLTIRESITLLTQAAEALGTAHAMGIVHRDLKPSNLFLVDGDLSRVKLLDFGVARSGSATRITKTGSVIGTPAYMAPEQARGAREIDARTDVFALGCVLFECLTGSPAFTGGHVFAVLAKILFEEAPRVSERKPEIPPKLDALIAQMLAKDPDKRPRDGAAVVAELARIQANAADTLELTASPASSGFRPSALTYSERRVLAVVLIGPGARRDTVAESANDDTGVLSSRVRALEEGALEEEAIEEEALRRRAKLAGGHLSRLADGSAIVVMEGEMEIPTDQTARAARCALALRAIAPARPIVLSTGRAEVTQRRLEGDVIDRAATLLSRLLSSEPGANQGGTTRIAIDEVTAGLLDARFEVVETAVCLEVIGERELVDGARTVLGNPTECVGRDWEITGLDALRNECVEESTACAVLLTGTAGMGKSRLAAEFLRRLRRRGDNATIWIGRVDALQAGSAFGLLGQALRSALGIDGGEPIEAQRQQILERVGRHAPAADQARIAGFLGEITGTPFPDEMSGPLRAARQDAQLMGDHMLQAWLDFLKAEALARPIVLVLEDLHWGDRSTVRFVDAALRDLRDIPWMVLALARPEVHEVFPNLWAERRMQEIRLKELSRKASERLVRQVLGDAVGDATMDRLVTQANGHAFYLEELIRASAEGKGDTLPETVLAMVEARLGRLPEDARRVLRAASVFGEVCWYGGVARLLGSAMREAMVSDLLSRLVEREVLVRRSTSRFPGEQAFAFRHALLREGAYAMLTGADRALGHRLAGEWLEKQGEQDPILLAEHFGRGDDPGRAGIQYHRAAEQAHRGCDTDAAIDYARRGLTYAVSDDVWSHLISVLCEIYAWRDEHTGIAASDVEKVLRLSPRGSAPWARAMLVRMSRGSRQGDLEGLRATSAEFLVTLEEVELSPEALGKIAFLANFNLIAPDPTIQLNIADRMIRRIHAIVDPVRESQPVAYAWLNIMHAMRDGSFKEDPWSGLESARTALSTLRAANHRRGIYPAQLFMGMNSWFLGMFSQAESNLQSSEPERDDIGPASYYRLFCLSGVLADRGALEEARGAAIQLIENGRAKGGIKDESRGRWALANVLLRRGELDAAEREARAAIELLSAMPLERPAATATLAAVLLARGATAEALVAAEEAMDRYRAFGVCGYFRGALVRLVHAEALAAAGRREEAREALTVARARVLAIAATIGDAEARRSFLEDVPENARTAALARAWADGGA